MGSTTDTATFDFSGFGLLLRGLPQPVAAKFDRDWRGFRSTGSDRPFLEFDIAVAGATVPLGAMTAKYLTSTFGDGLTRFSMVEGSIEIPSSCDHAARVTLAPGDPARQFYALTNMIVAAMAVRLPTRGAAVLHAAGAVIDGRGFALVGPAGSGKSTWVDIVKTAGGLYLSDDVILIDAEAKQILSMPIRGNHPVPHGPGRWPLKAILLPQHGAAPSLAPVSRMAATVKIAANLPFVAEQIECDPRLGDLVQRLIGGVPVYELTYSRDPAFLTCLAELR